MTLLQSEIPAHQHNLMASTSPANRTAPAGNSLARASGATPYIAAGGSTTTMAAARCFPPAEASPTTTCSRT